MDRTSLPLHAAFGAVRFAQPGDLDRIVQMVGRLAEYHGDTPTLTRDLLARDLSGDNPWIHVLVAEAADGLVGYAALCGHIQLQYGLRGLDLHHLFIEADFRGQGIGASLIEASRILAGMLSCRLLTVGTHPDNHRAQAFYAASGFSRQDSSFPQFSMTLPG